MTMPKSMLSNLWGLSSQETDLVVRNFADLGLITKTKYERRSEQTQDETSEDYSILLHDLIIALCQEMVDDGQKRHRKFIDALKCLKSLWIGEEIPKLEEQWGLKNGADIYGNLSWHMVKGGCGQELANLLSDVRWTLRRIQIGGWLSLKTDFEL